MDNSLGCDVRDMLHRQRKLDADSFGVLSCCHPLQGLVCMMAPDRKCLRQVAGTPVAVAVVSSSAYLVYAQLRKAQRQERIVRGRRIWGGSRLPFARHKLSMPAYVIVIAGVIPSTSPDPAQSCTRHEDSGTTQEASRFTKPLRGVRGLPSPSQTGRDNPKVSAMAFWKV